jgi:hypothetical protein
MRARVRMVVDHQKSPSQGLRIGLVVSSPEGGDLLWLTEPCEAPEVLEAQVEELQRGLKELLWEARAVFAKAARGEESPQVLPERPEELWALMECMGSLEHMRRIFNGLDEARRRELADFILGHVNVFKGAGALFAQHYEEEGGVLG